MIYFDLPGIAEHFNVFETIYNLFLIAINEAKNNPIRPGWELHYDLSEWNEYKFFSEETPSLQVKSNMRFVYQYNETLKNFYVLAVGLRNSKETRDSEKQQSIYFIAVERLKRLQPDYWRLIKNDY